MTTRRKITETIVVERVAVGQRIAVSLVAVSLGTISLALGLAFLEYPAPFLVLTPTINSAAADSTANAVTLNWTAPGDDGTTGQAAEYELRYSTAPLSAGNFGSANRVMGMTPPQPAGQRESTTVTNLSAATTYFFALRTHDDAGNVSGLSNFVTKTTAAAAEACRPTYGCSNWSACVNGQQGRTCTVTNNCPSGLDQPITTQACQGSGGPNASTLRQSFIVAGVGPGSVPLVRLIDPVTLRPAREFLAFARGNKNGTNVALGDVNGDDVADIIVGTGEGSDPLVRIFDTAGKKKWEFNPFPGSRKIGVAVTVNDLNNDGRDEVAVIPARGTSHLRVFSFDPAKQQFTSLTQGFVYPRSSRTGFTLASGDLNLDGRAEIIVAPRTAGRTVTVMAINANGQLFRRARFTPYPTTFRSGLTVAVADHDGNGRADILTAPGPGYYAHVKVITLGGRTLASFLPWPTTFRAGVELAAMDINRDGREEILVGPYARHDPTLRVFRFNTIRKRFELQQALNIFPRTMQAGLRLDAAPHI